MSEEKAPARPRQVTMAVVMAVVGSLVLVISLFDTLGRLRSSATREAVDQFLADAPGNTLGVDSGQVLETMRALAFFSGALAAMGLVFAIYVMQRHRGARIGFTVVAALLVLTVPVAGLMPFFLAVAAMLLWSRPARDWYVGRMPAPAGPTGTPSPALLSQPGYPPPSGQPGYPPPYAPQGYPVAPPGLPSAPAGDPDKRPMTVTIAVVLTWVGAIPTALMMLLAVVVLAADRATVIEEFGRAARQSDVVLTDSAIMALAWGIVVSFLVWSLIAVLLAFFAFRRSNGARYALVVSSVMTALFSLLSIMSLLSAVTLVLAVAVTVLLFTGGANDWYARRGGTGYPNNYPAGYPPGYPAPYPYPGYPQQTGQQVTPPPAEPAAPPPGDQVPPPPVEQPRRNQPW